MKNVVKIMVLVLVIVMIAGCGVRKYVPEGKALLVGNIVVNDSTKRNLIISEYSNYIVQKPNKSLLGCLSVSV